MAYIGRLYIPEPLVHIDNVMALEPASIGQSNSPIRAAKAGISQTPLAARYGWERVLRRVLRAAEATVVPSLPR
jgi:hypothetical protein